MREVFLTLSLLLVLTTPALGGNTTPTSGDCLPYCQEWIKVYEGKPDLGEGDVTNLDNQMNMVGHQAEGMDTMPESFYAFLKK